MYGTVRSPQSLRHGSVRFGGKLTTKGRTVGQSCESLPPKQRAHRYREMADAAFHRARDATDPERQAEYLGVAMGWHAMALDIEAHLRHLTQLEISQARLHKTLCKETKRPR